VAWFSAAGCPPLHVPFRVQKKGAIQ
jgi:hypothetical protein